MYDDWDRFCTLQAGTTRCQAATVRKVGGDGRELLNWVLPHMASGHPKQTLWLLLAAFPCSE